MCDRSCDTEDIGMPRTALQQNPKLLGVVTGRESRDEFNIAAIATAGVHMEDPWAATAARAQKASPEFHGRPPRNPSTIIWGQSPEHSRLATSATITNLRMRDSRLGGKGYIGSPTLDAPLS